MIININEKIREQAREEAEGVFKANDMILNTYSTLELRYGESITYFEQSLCTREYKEDNDKEKVTKVTSSKGGVVIPFCYDETFENRTDFCDSIDGDIYSAYYTFINEVEARMTGQGLSDVECSLFTYENEVPVVYIRDIKAKGTKYLKVYLGMIEEFMSNVCWFNMGAVITLLDEDQYNKYCETYRKCDWEVTKVDNRCWLAYYETKTKEYYK